MELVFAEAGHMDIWTIVSDLVARTKPIQQPANPPPQQILLIIYILVLVDALVFQYRKLRRHIGALGGRLMMC